MLATSADPFDSDDHLFEIKWDGTRAMCFVGAGGVRLMNRSLDTMDLTLHLERDGAFSGRPAIRHFTLDAMCELFGVIPHDRHTAGGDAFITAQVFLRLLRLATRFGRRTLSRLCEPFEVEIPS